MKLGNYMDLGSLKMMSGGVTSTDDEHCHAVRDVIVKDGRLQFPLNIRTKNQVMIAFEELLKEDRYFEESQRAVKAETERRRAQSSKNKNSYAANLGEDENDELECTKLSEGGNTFEDDSLLVCRGMQPKKSAMHVKVELGGKSVCALIDTGATDNFLQEDTAKALGLDRKMQPSDRHVILANGEREKIVGYLDVPAKLDGRDVNFTAYCFKGKGQPAIIGFKFLEENEYLVDCGLKRLIRAGQPDVECFEARRQMQKN